MLTTIERHQFTQCLGILIFRRLATMTEYFKALVFGAEIAQLVTRHLQQTPFAQRDHRLAWVYRTKLGNPFVARFAHMPAQMRVDIVWVDLYREQTEGRQHHRVTHRHIIGRANTWRCNITARAPTNIRHMTFTNGALDGYDQAMGV